MTKADIGLVGLAVMGENLVLNMEGKGFTVAVYNRTTSKVDAFLAGRGKGKRIIGVRSPAELAAALKPPRKVMMMVKAGQAVDDTIASLVEVLEPGDIIIDGGNSNYRDTIRRTGELESRGFLFVGAGVSGGEEGALTGPSIMPGGSAAAWPEVRPIFQAIAAKVGDGSPCCEWVGPDGAGHFVKMVHNGIEYGLMQAYAEGWELLEAAKEVTHVKEIFRSWREGTVIRSWLLDLMVEAMEDDEHLDKIEGYAADSGEGRWTVNAAVDYGVAVPTITAALFARFVSQQEDSPAMKMVAAMRNQFGGHAVRTEPDAG